MNHVMIDIETLGTKSDAVILSIGAVRFDPHDGTAINGERFYRKLDWKVQPGRVIDQGTLSWWLSQPDQTFRDTLNGDTLLVDAIGMLSYFLTDGYKKQIDYVWANGVSFDLGILSHAYESLGMIKPWHFAQEACMRSIKAIDPEYKKPRSGVYHNALDDAIWQAEFVVEVMDRMKAK